MNNEWKKEDTFFVWASPHQPTQEQVDDLKKRGNFLTLSPEKVKTFSNLHVEDNLVEKVGELVNAVHDVVSGGKKVGGFDGKRVIIVQPAGSPAFQAVLGMELWDSSLNVWWAHTDREVVEEVQNDGSVKKVSVFRHKGWTSLSKAGKEE